MSELYELPNGWEWIEFLKVFDNPTSKPYQITKSEYREIGKFPIIDQGKKFIIGYTNNEKKIYHNKSNCIIFGDHTREIKYVNFNFVIGADGTKIFKEKDITKYDLKYLYFQLLSKKIKSLGYSRHFKLIKKMSFAIPALQEQKRIVSKLDTLFEKIDKSIALHKKNMDEADVFMGSVLNDVFGDLEEKYEQQVWNEVLKIKNGKHYKDVIDDNGKYPIYGSGGIMNYANDYLCNENTVIIGRKGTINNPLFVKEKFWNIDTAFGIEANKNVLLPMFLFYFAKHFNFLDLNKSTTLPSLAKTHLLQIMMVLPPLNIQQKTVAYLDEISQKIEKIKSVQKEKMQSLVALKASILDQAFRGEL